MKKTLLTIALVAVSAAAFAQGRITAQNGNSLVALTTDTTKLATQDVGLAGQNVPTTGALPSGKSLMFGIYAGTASTSLSFVSAIPLNPVGGGASGVPGQIAPTHVLLPFAGGILAYLQVKIWESTYPSYEAPGALAGYSTAGSIFSMTPGTFAYPGIDVGGGTTYQNVPYSVHVLSPEPSTLALIGLGAATLLIFGRRKMNGYSRRPAVKSSSPGLSNPVRSQQIAELPQPRRSFGFDRAQAGFYFAGTPTTAAPASRGRAPI